MSRKNAAAISFLIVGIVVGIVAHSYFGDEPESASALASAALSSTSATPNSEPAVIDASNMHEVLRQEVEARRQLADTVARMEKELHALRTEMKQVPVASSAVNIANTTSEPLASAAPINSPIPDEQNLRDLGLSSGEVTQIRERFEQLEMDRLFLRDRATREGWMGTVRYSNEVAKLEAQRNDVRNSMGDTAYDAYLFSTGQANRVVVRDVLQGSPAQQAGLQSGDLVVRYGDKQLFNPRDLQTETGQGKLGELVRVEVDRDGRRMDMYVQRGPLGIYMDSDSKKP